MLKQITADTLYKDLLRNVKGKKGTIIFELAGVKLKINKTDTVGKTIQEWLTQYLIDKNYYFDEPENTQVFPDFFFK